MRGMLSLMSGLAQGYNQGTEQNYDRARQARMDQIALDESARRQTTFEQEQRQREALAQAGAPVAAVPAAPYDNGGVTADDEGNPLPPQAPMVSVAGQRVAADAAGPMVAAANTPEAVTKRQIGALRMSDPAKAASLEANSMRAEADKIELATKRWDADVQKARAGGLQAIVDFTNSSHADGEGGGRQSRAVLSPDGKTFSIEWVMPDGSTQTAVPPLPNNDEGLDRLAAGLTRGVPLDKRIAHYDQVADRKERAADREADNKRQDARDAAMRADREADNKRADRLADSTISYHNRMAGASETRADGAGKGSGKSIADRMPEAEKIAYNAAIKRTEKLEEAITKAKTDGTWDPAKNEGHKSLQTDFDAARMRASVLEKRFSGTVTQGSDPYDVRGKPDEPAKPSMQRTAETPSPSAQPRSVTVGGPKTATPANGSPLDIPEPPAEFKNVPGPGGFGGKQVPNPEFIAWQKTYGAAYAEKKRQEEAARAAANAAARSAPYRGERAPYARMGA